MANNTLTMADITRLTMLHMCSDPDRLSGAMLAAAGADSENETDGECVKDLLNFCRQEGIDPMPAIRKALEPSPFMKIFKSGSKR